MIDYQAQFLNSMLKKSKLQTSFTKTIINFIIQSIPIQDIRRTKLQTSLIYLHYLIDYLILWVLIGLIYNTQSLLAFDWPFIIIRGALSISFIIFKHPWIMMLQKIAVVLQITMAERSFIFLEAVAVFMEITMAAVWSLTKEQRMVHFDSKFQIFGGFLKQTTIYTCILIQSFFSRGSDSDDRQFLLISSILLVLIIDTSQIYYSHVTKALFLQLDFALILIGLLTIFRDTVQMGYSQFLFASIFLFIMVGIHLKLAPNQQNLRQDFNFHQIKGLPEEGLLEIIIKIKNNIASKDSDAIQTYFFKLKQETEDEKLLQKIQQCEQKSNEDKRQLINNFIFQTLKRAAKNSHRLKDLIIYLYSPSPRLYSFLDLQDWQHLREYKRIIAEQKNDVILREAEAEKQLQQIKKLIEEYYKISCVLFQQLMKDRIKQQKVQQYGEKLVCQLQQLQKIKQLGTSSEAIKDLINRFVLSCLPAKYQEPIMMNNQIEPQRLTEEAGSIVFGGQQDNQFRILDTNQCLTKLIYTKKEKYLKKPLSQILPPEFVQNLTLQIKRYNTKEGIDHHQQQKYCYIFNDLGFAVICRYKIQPTTHKTGRAWKLSLKQQYHERSMLIISKANRSIQGFTQLSRYLGLQLSAKKKVVRQDIFNILCNGSNSQLKKGQCLYNQGNQFARNTSIIFLDEIRYLSSTSFIIEMRTNEMNAKSIAHPLKKHQQSQQVVNFQFHYNWQGPKIVNRQQPQQIRLRDQYKQYKLKNIDYAYEITEMRYFREKIDYKSNFQQERDCPSLQPQIQKALTSLSIEQFFQKWERKRQTVPFWFKLSVFLMFLLFIFSLAGSIFFIISFNSEVDKTINIIQTSCKLHQKFQSVIILSQMTTLPHYNASIDTESSINNQTTYTNDLSSELFFLDQNIFNNPMGQTVLDNFNTLNLYINSYLLNSNHPYDNILSLVSQTIYPNFTIFINNFIDLFGNISTNQIRNIVLIACIIICVLLIALIKLIDYRQRQRRKQVAQILKFIDNNDLSIMKEKITKFKEIWIDNIDGRELDQFIENDEQSSSPPKHLIIDWHFAKRNLFYILWLGAFITLLTLANISISNFQNITSNYISFNHHLSSQISDLQVIWTQYNAVTPNKTFIQSLATSNLENQFQKNTKLKIMAGSLQVDPIFIQNYGAFWQTQRICNYIDDPQCLSILGGAMAEGANMAICYLNIQHDGYLALNLSNFALYNQSTALSVGRLSFFYLPQFTKINNIYILDQLNLTAKQYKENVQYFCIGVIFVSLSSIIILFWAINERKKNNRLDQLLMIMPFEKLKNFSAFHKYYQRYYLSY